MRLLSGYVLARLVIDAGNDKAALLFDPPADKPPVRIRLEGLSSFEWDVAHRPIDLTVREALPAVEDRDGTKRLTVRFADGAAVRAAYRGELTVDVY